MSRENEPTEAEFALNEGGAGGEPSAPLEGDGGGEQTARGPGTGPEQEPGTQPGPGPEDQPEPGPEAQTEIVEELRDRWQRAMADADNLRKRHVRELERERSAERARTAAALLPVIDHLEMALEHAESDPSAVIEGVRAVRDQAVSTFEKLGFPRHDEVGVPFDPARHEAVGTVEDDGVGPGVVKAVLRPGYGDGPGQLRPAAVTVTARQE